MKPTARGTKSLILLLVVFSVFTVGVVLSYRFQLMLGGANADAMILPKNFVNPFIVKAQQKETVENPFNPVVLGANQVSETEVLVLLLEAKQWLGCQSINTCKELCKKNRNKCQDFLNRVNLRKDRVTRDLLLEKAQNELGCTSFEYCKNFCENNPKMCISFIEKFNLAPISNQTTLP